MVDAVNELRVDVGQRLDALSERVTALERHASDSADSAAVGLQFKEDAAERSAQQTRWSRTQVILTVVGGVVAVAGIGVAVAVAVAG